MSEIEKINFVCPGCRKLNRITAVAMASGSVCERCGIVLPLTPVKGLVGELTSANFSEIVENVELPVVVNFWTSWCGHCRNFEPIFADAALQLEAKASFFRVETEEEPELVRRFAMMTTPTQLVFKGGQEVARQTGVSQLPLLLHWLNSRLN